ncbi:hypothetical protein B0T26DRAFT_807206 [Lasiosphaeria miniovina]|uniref:Uncharacterized protein n=1 Tax=Lasiosphaeria miniovina TaxID=1954250 RepID=A0AA40DJJ0_9PEZI|nr:uncharacterized protein B0T26DRAFT_807206 [Lasiosphaeria miniovina]KAK0703716.1 hypothetical protein B0T26DRAFT_807206 [Lasiosphaeria miniovina]
MANVRAGARTSGERDAGPRGLWQDPPRSVSASGRVYLGLRRARVWCAGSAEHERTHALDLAHWDPSHASTALYPEPKVASQYLSSQCLAAATAMDMIADKVSTHGKLLELGSSVNLRKVRHLAASMAVHVPTRIHIDLEGPSSPGWDAIQMLGSLNEKRAGPSILTLAVPGLSVEHRSAAHRSA